MKSVTYKKALAEQQHFLGQLATKDAVKRLKRTYDDAHDALVGKLARAAKAGKGQSFDSHQYRQMLLQVKAGQAKLANALAGELGVETKIVQKKSIMQLENEIAALEKKYSGAEVSLPIAEMARFSGAINARETSLLKMHTESMVNYGVKNVAKMEQALSISLATGETTAEAVDRIMDVADLAWHQGERIVRTELAWAYNATQNDGIVAAASEFPDLKTRWSEHVSDGSGAPLDDRVAVDSIAMHGQVVTPGGFFVMPPTAPYPDAKGNTKVPDALVGLSWQFPPNRPNDRAVVQPWRPHWGIPAWEWSGRRVAMKLG